MSVKKGMPNKKEAENISIKNMVISYTDIVIKEEVLLLVDSDGTKVDESKLSREVSCKKIFTPTWNRIKELLQELKGKSLKNVKQIWVHVGTNDTNNNEPSKVIKCIEENLGNMKNTFPEAEILTSKLIPRKSGKYTKRIKEINEFLEVYCKQNYMPLVKYKIDENMLDDDKHLNRKGFQIMLGTLKYVLFGIIPQIYVYERKNNHRGNRNPHFNKNQNGGRY